MRALRDVSDSEVDEIWYSLLMITWKNVKNYVTHHIYIDPDSLAEAALLDERAPSFKEEFLNSLGLKRRPDAAADTQEDPAVNAEPSGATNEDDEI